MARQSHTREFGVSNVDMMLGIKIDKEQRIEGVESKLVSPK